MLWVKKFDYMGTIESRVCPQLTETERADSLIYNAMKVGQMWHYTSNNIKYTVQKCLNHIWQKSQWMDGGQAIRIMFDKNAQDRGKAQSWTEERRIHEQK